jgi:hypothetical protein
MAGFSCIRRIGNWVGTANSWAGNRVYGTPIAASVAKYDGGIGSWTGLVLGMSPKNERS